MSMTIERAFVPTAEVAQLVAELEAALDANYTADQRHGLALEQLFEPHIRFFIARLDGEAVGCGGVALFDDYAEVKRMYSHEAARGRGIGKSLLAHIEAQARAVRVPLLRLETGPYQTAAIRLYESCGFRPCEKFGHYAGLPPHRIAMSLFYEKRL
jgi:putative acetyltransferase